jgi:hypothetical protein
LRVVAEGLARQGTVAYIRPVHISRRKTGTILRAVIPLLALVWTSLPLHHCNVAFAASAAAMPAPVAATPGDVSASPVAMAGCHHHGDEGEAPARTPVPCSDLGRAAPDLRPAVVLDVGLAHVTWDAYWRHRGLAPVSLRGVPRAPDEDRWRSRPLHLQKSVLLI